MKKTFLFGFVLCVTSAAAFGVRPRATVLQDSRRAAVYHRDGARFALEGRLWEAVAAFEQAVALDPKNGNSHYSLANVYSELGRWEDAVAAYRKAVSLNGKDVEAYNGLGIALSNRGVYVQAAAAFRRAIDIYPKWAEPYYHLSNVYKKLGQEVAAQVAYTEAIQRRPDYAARPPLTFRTTAKAAASEPRSEKAASAVNAVPSSDVPSKNNAPARDATPDAAAPSSAVTPRADEAASKAARLSSDDARAYYDLGIKHNRAGRHEDAVAALRRAVILDREDAATHLALGDAYAGLGRWGESVDAYERAARLDPNNAQVYEKLGRSYARLRETTPPAVAGGEKAGGVKAASPSSTPADAQGPRDNVPARRNDGAGGVRRAETNEGPASPVGVASPEDGVDPTTVYLVGAGDVLDVRVLNGRNPQATSYTVTSAGLLDYPPLTEPLKVAGLTTDQIASRLGAELKRRGVSPAPEVSVGVREYVSHAIIISGLVKDPGAKILRREGVPLYVIVAHSQPLPEAGSATIISRSTGRTTTVNLSDARAANTLLVRPGDVINVGAREKQYFYIAGAVREPGRKEFQTGLTLTQAVLAAGGVSAPGAAFVTIARQGPDGRLTTSRYDLRDIGAGRSPDPSVQPGDRIEVLR